MKIGILVHGRHVEAQGWEYMMWGNPPHILGLLPRFIQIVLQYNLDSIDCIFIGSGVRTQTEHYESEHIYEFLIKNLDMISQFESITPLFETIADKDIWKSTLLSKIILDTESQNTQQEILNASSKLSGCDQILQITSCSHAPRCIKTTSDLVTRGIVSTAPIWMVIPDMTPYFQTRPSDICIFEPPHRSDDPFIEESITPNQVFQQLFRIKNHEDRVSILRDVDKAIKKIID